MKYVLFIFLVIPLIVSSGELKEVLNANNSSYFPKDAQYYNYDNICNEQFCFTAVAVDYVSTSQKGMVRIAIFNDSQKYLGVYSGLPNMPTIVSGNKLSFPATKYGMYIRFTGETPPEEVYIEGESYEFEANP